MKELQSFAENNEQTQGKFTIGDEKVSFKIGASYGLKADQGKEYNVFMKLDVSSCLWAWRQYICANFQQDPTVQKATGKTDAIDVMGALREMKNSM